MSDSIVSKSWFAAFAAKDRRPIYEWAAEHVTLPSVLTRSGRFDVGTSRHFIAPFEAIADDRVREVNVLAPPRSGKTLLADIAIPWFISVQGASVLFVIQTEEMAKSHSELRTMPLLKSVPAIAEMLPADRHKERSTEILFTNGLPLIVCGPSISNLQNRGFRVVISDETWILADKHAGRLEEAKARLGDFLREQNSKLLCISQGGKAGDDWHNQFKSGTLHEWEVACLGCGQYFEPRFSGHRADGSRWGITWYDERTEGGLHNIAQAVATLRYECPHCAHRHTDTPATKHAWNESGRYRFDAADSQKKKSFHWSNVIDFPWSELVEKWLRAREQSRLGAELPTIQFMQKQLAEFHDPAKAAHVETLPSVAVSEPTADGKFWEKQDFIFLAVDKQLSHFWALVEAWSKDGESMVLWAGRLETWSEVADKQAEFKVPDQCVFVDCGNWQNEVWTECVRHGHVNAKGKWKCWWALRGSASPAFTTKRADKGKVESVRLPYSWPPDKGDPCFGLSSNDARRQEFAGKTCPVVTWSNPTIKDIAGSRRDAMTKGRLAFVGHNVNEQFSRHLFAETKRPDDRNPGKWSWQVVGKRPNHLWDCWCMSATAACMAGVIKAIE